MQKIEAQKEEEEEEEEEEEIVEGRQNRGLKMIIIKAAWLRPSSSCAAYEMSVYATFSLNYAVYRGPVRYKGHFLQPQSVDSTCLTFKVTLKISFLWHFFQ